MYQTSDILLRRRRSCLLHGAPPRTCAAVLRCRPQRRPPPQLAPTPLLPRSGRLHRPGPAPLTAPPSGATAAPDPLAAVLWIRRLRAPPCRFTRPGLAAPSPPLPSAPNAVASRSSPRTAAARHRHRSPRATSVSSCARYVFVCMPQCMSYFPTGGIRPGHLCPLHLTAASSPAPIHDPSCRPPSL